MNKISVDISKLIGITSFEGGLPHKRGLEEALRLRTEILKHITRGEAAALAEAVGGRLVDAKIDSATDWVIALKPLPSFEVYFFLQRYAPEFEDTVQVLYSAEALNQGLPAEDVSSFTILYLNALIYSAKKLLKRDLPKLGRYL